MSFYKKIQKKVNNLWYPQSITVGKPISTREVADQLSAISTVTRGDTYAVMENLGQVLSSYMGQGRTVKIDGVGTFYYTASANKCGVAKAEDVTASLIKGVRVRFIPEVGRNSGGKVATRSMAVLTTIPKLPALGSRHITNTAINDPTNKYGIRLPKRVHGSGELCIG